MFNTNFAFVPGKLTFLLDGGAGSSGKGKLASFVAEHANNWDFCCNAFSAQAGHWVKLDDGREYFYQTFNSCAYLTDRYEKMYIGPGAHIELPALLREYEENNIKPKQLGIHPLATIIQDKDMAFERGEVDLDGNQTEKHDGTMAKGSTCLHRNSIIETEDGPMTIGEMIDSQFTGNVLSLSNNGKFVYSKVIGHQRVTDDGSKKWVVIGTKNRSRLICTDDHRCAIINDIMDPQVEYTEAKNLPGKHIVKIPNGGGHAEHALYNNDQLSAMVGSLFGDGSINKGYYWSEHGHKQKEYVEYKQLLFGGTISEHKSGWNNENKSYRLSTKINAHARYLRKLFFVDNRKTVKHALKYLNPIALAFWYMDDGTLCKRKGKSPTAILCTDSFTEEDNYLIKDFLQTKFDIASSVDHRNRIRLSVDGSKKLWRLISEYVHPIFNYKIPDEFVCDKHCLKDISTERLEFAAKYVREIEYVSATKHYQSDFYDIEVENTHNFIADGNVVHNCHGVGAAKARRVLRRPDVQLARDTDVLKEFICNTDDEIIERLNSGQSGLLEVAQGFQLSLMHRRFYPYTTSRNVTVSAALDDMFLPPLYAGPVIINFRTYPIRINNKKYLDPHTNEHLTWDQVEERGGEGSDQVKVYEGNSGPGYPDQHEITWDELSAKSGSPNDIIEMTSVTKLPRRVFTFSNENMIESIKYNETGYPMYLSINFANYVDYDITGDRGVGFCSAKFMKWCEQNILGPLSEHEFMDQFGTKPKLKFIGTGAKTDDMIML